MNSNLLKNLIIISSLVGLSILWLNKCFFRVDDSYPPELYDFNTTDFEFSANRPLFYYSNGELYYNQEGKITFDTEPIWSGKIESEIRRFVSVSPNSEYIALNNDEKRILILDTKGNIVFDLQPINESFTDHKTGNFWSDAFQWNERSTVLYFMNDSKWIDKFSKENESSLCAYDIESETLRKVIPLEEECTGYFFLSRDEQHLYYTSAVGGYKKVNIQNGETMGIFHVDEKLKMDIPKDSIFINYIPRQFGEVSHNFEHIITTSSESYEEAGIYSYYKTSPKLLIRGKYGFAAFKGHHYSFLQEGLFLPGNRFYVAELYSKDHDGTIVIDVQNYQYQYIDRRVECFFSITNDDQPDFEVRLGEILPNSLNHLSEVKRLL